MTRSRTAVSPRRFAPSERTSIGCTHVPRASKNLHPTSRFCALNPSHSAANPLLSAQNLRRYLRWPVTVSPSLPVRSCGGSQFIMSNATRCLARSMTQRSHPRQQTNHPPAVLGIWWAAPPGRQNSKIADTPRSFAASETSPSPPIPVRQPRSLQQCNPGHPTHAENRQPENPIMHPSRDDGPRRHSRDGHPSCASTNTESRMPNAASQLFIFTNCNGKSNPAPFRNFITACRSSICFAVTRSSSP